MKEGVSIISRLYLVFSKRGFLLFSLAVTAALILIMGRIDSRIAGQAGYGTFYLQVAFERPVFEAILASWGPDGISFYLETMWIVFLYAVFLPLMLASGAAYFSEAARSIDPGSFSERAASFLLLVPLYTVTQWIETAFHMYILLGRNFDGRLIFISSCISVLKYLLLLGSLVWMLKKYALFRRVMKGKDLPPAV